MSKQRAKLAKKEQNEQTKSKISEQRTKLANKHQN
jgi:hypothetical protein